MYVGTNHSAAKIHLVMMRLRRIERHGCRGAGAPLPIISEFGSLDRLSFDFLQGERRSLLQ